MNRSIENLKLGRVRGIKRPTLLGRKFSEKIINKIRDKSKGKHYSIRTEWKKGHTPEGSILFKKGGIPWNKGKTFPERWHREKLLHQGKYWLIFKPDHPYSDQKGYVREHRLVLEEFLGRYLSKDELVHHKNGIKTDNRIGNLEVMTRSQHIKMHHKKILDARWKRI